MTIGLVHDPVFQEHDPGSYHCESPGRLIELDRALKEWPGYNSLEKIPLRAATQEELSRIHLNSHIKRLASMDGQYASLDPDTGCSPESHRVSLLAAGALIDLCDKALDGKIRGGMALVRPPGHHATANRAMGFCFFNNIALAAAHLTQQRNLERVLIIDWDVHHGNGTEEAFYFDDKVLYFSTHQFPFYPGTGAVTSMGRGKGLGYNLNLPLPSGMGDRQFIHVFEKILAPVAHSYRPQFILISAGFDAHKDDPLGGMRISDLGFSALTRIVMEIADKYCPGNVVMTLEGGYNPPALGRSVIRCLEAMEGDDISKELRQKADDPAMPSFFHKALKAFSEHWKLG